MNDDVSSPFLFFSLWPSLRLWLGMFLGHLRYVSVNWALWICVVDEFRFETNLSFIGLTLAYCRSSDVKIRWRIWQLVCTLFCVFCALHLVTCYLCWTTRHLSDQKLVVGKMVNKFGPCYWHEIYAWNIRQPRLIFPLLFEYCKLCSNKTNMFYCVLRSWVQYTHCTYSSLPILHR